MRRPLLFLCAALLALMAPRAAPAAEGIYLRWEDCPLGGAGTSNNQVACLFNEGDQVLYCAFTLGTTIEDVIGIEVVVDMQNSVAPLPDWWTVEGEGACRPGALRASGNFTADPSCTDPWLDLGGGTTIFYPGLPRGLSSQARMIGTYAIRSDSARTLIPGPMYYGLKLLISNQRSIFPGECSGCLSTACFVLNAVKLLRPPGAPGGDLLLQTPGPADANRVVWLGGAGSDCTAVPVRRTTWGRIRSLYR